MPRPVSAGIQAPTALAAGGLFLCQMVPKRRFQLLVNLGVGSNLPEQRSQRVWQLLGVLHNEHAAGLKGAVEHAEHAHPLRLVEVQ